MFAFEAGSEKEAAERLGKYTRRRLIELGIADPRPADLLRASNGKLSYTHAGRIMRGEILPKLETLTILAKALQVTRDYLLQEIGVTSPPCEHEEPLFREFEELAPESQKIIADLIKTLPKKKPSDE